MQPRAPTPHAPNPARLPCCLPGVQWMARRWRRRGSGCRGPSSTARAAAGPSSLEPSTGEGMCGHDRVTGWAVCCFVRVYMCVECSGCVVVPLVGMVGVGGGMNAQQGSGGSSALGDTMIGGLPGWRACDSIFSSCAARAKNHAALHGVRASQPKPIYPHTTKHTHHHHAHTPHIQCTPNHVPLSSPMQPDQHRGVGRGAGRAGGAARGAGHAAHAAVRGVLPRGRDLR